MIINTNISALNARRNLENIDAKQANASARLSSGLKINGAADDAAGLAISEKMKTQIRGLKQAERNVQDGISLIQTAEGGMSQISEMVIRQRELIIQSLNDTYSDEDRVKIQAEIDQLTLAVDSIANETQFNNIPLLNVPYLKTPPDIDSPDIDFPDIDPPDIDPPDVDPPDTDPPGNIGSGVITTSSISPLDPMISVNKTANVSELVNGVLTEVEQWELKGGVVQQAPDTIFVAEIDTNSASLTILVSDYTPPRNAASWPDLNIVLVNNDNNSETIYGYDGSLGGGGTVNVPGGGTIGYTGISGNPEQFNVTNLPTNYSIKIYIRNGGSVDAHNFTIQVKTPSTDFNIGTGGPPPPPRPAPTPTPKPTPNPPLKPTPTPMQNHSLWIQSGANTAQGMYIDCYDCRASSLGINPILVAPTEEARAALAKLDNSLNIVNEYRANCGSQQNRLEHARGYLSIAYLNLEESNSRIADTDMAKEMMELTKSNALQQAAISMLAQANQRPQSVLELLG